MKKTDKIYVAGHLGLVGSALTKRLRQAGYENLILRSRKELDLTNQQAVDAFFAAERVDYLFLAAAHVGGILANNSYRADFIYNNLMIQNNVIHAAYNYGVRKLLFLGSSCIYPREAEQPMREEALLTAPLEYTNEPYAIAKIAGIKLCESYNLQYGTNFIAVMPTNLYGPNDNFDLEKSHVLPAMVRKIHLANCLNRGAWALLRSDLNRRPVQGIDGEATEEQIVELLASHGIFADRVVLWGTGMPKREFLWSEEMAEACLFLMEQVDFDDIRSQLSSKEVRNTHINIGTGREHSIAEIGCMIKEVVGFDGELSFDAGKPDGTMRKLMDVTKLHELGWHHQIEVEEGVRRLYDWYLSDL